MVSPGQVFVISAPSGAGKTSLVSSLLEADAHLKLSVSHTTRASRSGEVEGQDYFFVSQTQFDQLVSEDQMLEYASVYGNSYGTSKAYVDQMIQSGQDVILEIDWQGAEQIRATMPEALSIFIMPPSPEILLERLTQRNSDHPEVIANRMAELGHEIAQSHYFDYIVLNEDFAEALRSLQAIIQSSRLESDRQINKLAKILEKFGKKG